MQLSRSIIYFKIYIILVQYIHYQQRTNFLINTKNNVQKLYVTFRKFHDVSDAMMLNDVINPHFNTSCI